MKIYIIDSFLGDSHKQWAESYKNFSSHKVEILGLSGHHWKWRMTGGAIHLADKFNQIKEVPHLIIATDMVNIPLFKALIAPKFQKVPVVMYFHENQFGYPISDFDSKERDLNYAFINYTSALVADYIFFNSNYNKNTFFNGLKRYLNMIPKPRNKQNLETLDLKSSILPLGIDLKKFNSFKCKKSNKTPIILWNHRWEYDKNPNDFYNLLCELNKEHIDFKLAITGQDFNQKSEIFNLIKETFNNQIIQYGFMNSFEEYAKILWQADIIPVTSNQDFFGVSIMEAVYCNTIPILPNRLTYPELFDQQKNSPLFYNNFSELIKKTISILKSNHKKNCAIFDTPNCYDWSTISDLYDTEFDKIVKMF